MSAQAGTIRHTPNGRHGRAAIWCGKRAVGE